ncbi:MAG: hypothetical protein DLM72_17325 [Candidatus Nitrosopolaris wilkensis]|nr:MAG: hypothetical protein DLM72_17325 [Candidatus Nitrosopolaris wilkensis]
MTGIVVNTIDMPSSVLLMLIATTIGLSLLMTNNFVSSSMAASKGNGGAGAGPVVQEQVNTGNPALDKAINKFYSCISKTHQDPPSIQIVDDCYYQNSIGGTSGPGTKTYNINNIETHSTPTSSSRIPSPPPGVLVEVP